MASSTHRTQSFHFDDDDDDGESYEFTAASDSWTDYLNPSNEPELDLDSDVCGLDPDSPVDAYSCDHFRMFEFKVRKCARGRSHDWTECPYAHPGEKARRRDPRKYHYSGTACPDFRKGSCKKGDSCEFAHGVFECWLHPARYRTQPCEDGPACKRRVCFFAHTPDQLRILPQQSPRSIDASSCATSLPFLSSPESISDVGRGLSLQPSLAERLRTLDPYIRSLSDIESARLDASNSQSSRTALFDPASDRRLSYPYSNFPQVDFSLNQINATSSNRSYFNSSVVYNYNITQWSPNSTRVEEQPLFNRPRLRETFLAITSQTALTMLTIRTSGSTNFSQNAKILFCSAAAFNVIGFLSCLFGILLCGRKTGVKARTVTGIGFVFTAYGFLAIMGMLLNDNMMLWITGLACVACFPALASAFMK
ncbi:hypothetical protein JRO89_XS03G0027200 [Xanthoceras sorbifolium]|uniref:C3H1-type domain-containing protein n=1 Tax=Xanthoceras sorbifolium TaxID=99658 RepID=A0ABQ8I8B1_9ROSI|nr:hypothetical protein JRO89_XS03G0027200 [Xanthoceras sorbifolium]